MRSYLLTAIALAGAIRVAKASTEVVYDDAAVSREFLHTTGHFCGTEDPIKTSLKWILNTCCEGDTNRYLRIAKETATNNPKFSNMAIALVEEYGGVDDVPFLYQFTNSTKYISGALEVVLKLGGLTEESVAAASAYLVSTNSYHVLYQSDVAEELFRAAANPSAPASLRTIASSNVLHFASNNSGGSVEYDDIGLKNADPSYKYSKRRLSVLRAVLPDCQGYDNLMNYVTNAINELVAYPEANLPD